MLWTDVNIYLNRFLNGFSNNDRLPNLKSVEFNLMIKKLFQTEEHKVEGQTGNI